MATELRVPKYLLVAAREENMTKAARLLRVTQSALLRRMARLEVKVRLQFRRGQFIRLEGAMHTGSAGGFDSSLKELAILSCPILIL